MSWVAIYALLHNKRASLAMQNMPFRITANHEPTYIGTKTMRHPSFVKII